MDINKYNIEGYNLLYDFESNLKLYIYFQMDKVYGEDWFKLKSATIHDKCEGRMKQKIKYLSSGTQEFSLISFSFFSEIRSIIQDNWDKVFFDHFSNVNARKDVCKTTTIQKLFEIEVIRNTLSHAQPISEDNLKLLELNIKFFKAYIPKYDDETFKEVSSPNKKNYDEQLFQIQSLVSNDKQIDMKLIANISNLKIKSQLEIFSKLPRTRDSKNSPEYCELKNNILGQLKTLLGEDHV